LKFQPIPSVERLQEVLYYEPDTGLFLWKEPTSNRVLTNEECGRICSKGYLWIAVDRCRTTAQRLAWTYVTGQDIREWYVDHIDGNRLNNAFGNLQLLSNKDNIRKSKKGKGYTYHKRSGKYMARIRVDGKLIHLGYFSTEEEARKAYLAARIKYFGDNA
jgi:hypothetical protein